MKKFIFNAVFILLCIMTSVPALALNEALKEIDAITIDVKTLDQDAKRAHLKESKISQAISAQLQKAGIQTKEGEAEPRLEIIITVIRNFGNRTASYRIRLRDWVLSSKDRKTKMLATVWEKGGMLSASNWKLEEKVQVSLREMTEAFIADYYSENPSAADDLSATDSTENP